MTPEVCPQAAPVDETGGGRRGGCSPTAGHARLLELLHGLGVDRCELEANLDFWGVLRDGPGEDPGAELGGLEPEHCHAPVGQGRHFPQLKPEKNVCFTFVFLRREHGYEAAE